MYAINIFVTKINILPWSKIYTPPFKYVDDSFDVRSYSNTYEHGMSLIHNFNLSELNAQSINSYNSLYLTNRKDFNNLFQLNLLKSDLETITTYIRFNNGKYLQFIPESYGITDEDVPSSLTRFQLQFTKTNRIIIKHIFNKVEYRLCLLPDNSISFLNDSAYFFLDYLINDDGDLVLYNPITHYILTIDGNTLRLDPIQPSSDISNDSILHISNNFTNIDYNLNNSWVSYDTSDINLAKINNNNSVFNLPSQYLIYTTYSNSFDYININYISLKTNISETNTIKRGSSLNGNSTKTPGTDYRFYTSLNTGNQQEKGNENITLTYTFFDKDIYTRANTDTIFLTPSSLHPYNKININDTQFISNGAFGSSSPMTSDKIKRVNRSTTSYNNGNYLCTWLSANNTQTDFLWVDRYYYPDLIDRETALSIYAPSLEDPINKIIDNNANLYQHLQISPIFDKKSDMCLEPNSTYIYQRVGNDSFSSFIEELSSNIVFFNKDEINFNTDSYVIPITDINKSKNFTISFDLYIKPAETIGYSLLSNLTDSGFGILNDTFITPLFHTTSGTQLFTYNYNGDIISKQYFHTNIKDVDLFNPLDEFIITCENGNIYNVLYNNTINKMLHIPKLSAYLSITKTSNNLAYLLNNSGDVIILDKNTLTYIEDTVIKLNNNVESIFYYKSQLYGVDGVNIKYYDEHTICYIKDSTIYKYDLLNDTLIPVIQSPTLVDYSIQANGDYLILHNNSISKYNKNREFVFSTTLSSIAIPANCDFIRVMYNNSTFTQILVTGNDINNNSIYSIFDINGNLINTFDLKGNTHNNLTNYNYHITNQFKKKLSFKIKLKNIKNEKDILIKNIDYDYSNISEGFVTFTYTFNSLTGTIRLYINGNLFETVYFDPVKYTIDDIFNDQLILGAAGFYGGQTLSTFIKQPHYYTYNTQCKNIFILDKSVDINEANIFSLVDTPLNDIVLSIPCGQRSNIEEIIRVFKFGVPNSYSNVIDIDIKNSNITDINLQNTLINSIKQNISKYVKSDVTINNITFTDYNNESIS